MISLAISIVNLLIIVGGIFVLLRYVGAIILLLVGGGTVTFIILFLMGVCHTFFYSNEPILKTPPSAGVTVVPKIHSVLELKAYCDLAIQTDSPTANWCADHYGQILELRQQEIELGN